MRRVFLGRGVVVFGLVVIILLVMVAVLAPWLAPSDPYEQQLDASLQQPSLNHLLGTDSLGRDTLSRIIYGSRNSLMGGIIALGIAATIGMTLGLISGFFGGWISHILMRCVDALMCFPMILLAMVIAALLGNGLKNVMIALGIAMLPGYGPRM